MQESRKLLEAILITAKEYLELDSPEFVGQTRPALDGEYRMYWKVDNQYYYTLNKI